jgi:hypothetical protein
MINDFPFLSEEKKKEVTKWLALERDSCKSDKYRYRSLGNEVAAVRCSSRASAFESIMIHMKYHMKEKEK